MTLERATQRARMALSDSAEELERALGENIAKLLAAREAMRRPGYDLTEVGALYMRAHDLKALGQQCGFPLVTELAASVCRLFDDKHRLHFEQMGLVDDHLDAIKAAYDRGVRTVDDPWASQTLADLQRDLQNR